MTVASVDVIIPCYNTGCYIREAVESVLAQTVLPGRIIVVNDGSTDHTAELVQELIEKNRTSTKIVHHYQSNAGLSAARNKGISLSNAEYIAFLDADDVWMPQKLERQLEVFSNTQWSDLGLVYGGFRFIDEKGASVTGEYVLPLNPNMRGKVFEKLTLGNAVNGSASCVILKRLCTSATGGFDTALKAFEDWDYWLRVAQNFSFDFVNEDLVKIRLHTNSMQKDRLHMRRNAILFYKKWTPRINVQEALAEWGFQLAKAVYIDGWNASALRELNRELPGDVKRKLFRRTFGSLTLYAALQWLRKKCSILI
ncbi:MAG: glycosyltransferase family 2 protein [Bacteroidetes bacterium]|jgi:glycosyltransferase involved in cell wall biosynthesis|nr:glycosyltransferase family 2 protein [Bacteroidota bacterium]